MTEAPNKSSKKFWFWLSVTVNLGFLGVFKYYNFFIESFTGMLSNFGVHANPWTFGIILPVGISFYTFHGLSYVIDIYNDRIKAEKNFIEYSVFVSFFPLLVAGPIERATHLLPQVKRKREFDIKLFKEGVIQIFWGLFRKIVIADTLAIYVDTIYGHPDIHNSSSLLMATTFYAFQIYFDFSGYSDIAIGTAKLFGFNLLQNFNLPYFSRSLTEFWRKWHMSLSFWLRDYLYIPLGGNRKGIFNTYKNLLLTMLIGGLWHGANWTFIVWGGIHGVVLAIEKFIHGNSSFNFLKRLRNLGFLVTFGVVLLSWVFFRSANLAIATTIIKNIFAADFSMPFIGDINVIINSFFVLSIGVCFDLYLFRSNMRLEDLGSKFSMIKIVLFITVVLILINLFYSTSNNFIYFQF